jgi:hypothetical protein
MINSSRLISPTLAGKASEQISLTIVSGLTFVYNRPNDVHEVKLPAGHSVKAGLRRLRKDRPDIHALVGELSPVRRPLAVRRGDIRKNRSPQRSGARISLKSTGRASGASGGVRCLMSH